MITLSNDFSFEYMIASGALAFNCKGWFWERPLAELGLIRPEFFAIVTKTLTIDPRKGNLRWWKPWECVSLIPGGAVNKVALTNPGFSWWCNEIAPKINFKKLKVVVSVFADGEDLSVMAGILDRYELAAIEVNPSCPNTGHPMETAETIVRSVEAVTRVTRHPVILKLSVAQPYLEIAERLIGVIEAVALNSVPYEIVFPGRRSPLAKLEDRVGGGGGGVSGKPAQLFNWKAVRELAEQSAVPVIGPDVMEYDDMAKIRKLGASAVSFGTIHLPDYPVWKHPLSIFTNPCKPTGLS